VPALVEQGLFEMTVEAIRRPDSGRGLSASQQMMPTSNT